MGAYRGYEVDLPSRLIIQVQAISLKGIYRVPLKGFGVLCAHTYMGGCPNYGPCLGVHIEEDIDIDVDIDTDS